jgi:hypothetical protein
MKTPCAFSLALMIGAASVAKADAPARPNIIVVLADDLGYGDIACYGHPRIKTPHLDRFAKNGLKLTSCYASAANCSPAASLGMAPIRVTENRMALVLAQAPKGKEEVTELQTLDRHQCLRQPPR